MKKEPTPSKVVMVAALRHPDAPSKPPWGAPCNGCGLCCLAQPCPLGMVLSRRMHGACVALRWSEHQQRYLCTALAHPLWGRLARRWIAAGIGCDAHVDVVQEN